MVYLILSTAECLWFSPLRKELARCMHVTEASMQVSINENNVEQKTISHVWKISFEP